MKARQAEDSPHVFVALSIEHPHASLALHQCLQLRTFMIFLILELKNNVWIILRSMMVLPECYCLVGFRFKHLLSLIRCENIWQCWSWEGRSICTLRQVPWSDHNWTSIFCQTKSCIRNYCSPWRNSNKFLLSNNRLKWILLTTPKRMGGCRDRRHREWPDS